MNEKDTMKNSRKTNVKSNTSDIEAKEKKEQQEQEKILAAKYLIELIRSVLEERKPQPKPEKVSMKQLFLTAKITILSAWHTMHSGRSQSRKMQIS